MIRNSLSLVIIFPFLVAAGILFAEEEGGVTGIDAHLSLLPPITGNFRSPPSPTPCGDPVLAATRTPVAELSSQSPIPGDFLSSPVPTPRGDPALTAARTPVAELSSSLPSPSGTLPVSASPTPVPIIPKQEVSGGFIRYIPDNNGDMEWKLEGSTVRFLSDTCLEIMDMEATSLSTKIGYLTISTGKVLYYTGSKKAQADGERITVRRENMVLTGRGFSWLSNLEQIRVNEDVKVLIKEKGNIGLFPL